MKKQLMACLLLSLAACATITPSSLIYFSPTSTTGASITSAKSFALITQDARPSPYISIIKEDYQPDINLNASQEVKKTFENAVFQQFLSQGFNVTRDSQNTVTLTIKSTIANVTQLEVDYKIETQIDLQLVAQTPQGKLTKNYKGTSTEDGSFDPSLLDIQENLNKAASRVLAEIANDQELQQYMVSKF